MIRHFLKNEQLYSLFISAAIQVARICMGDDRLARPCTHDVGVALFVVVAFDAGGFR